MKNKYLITILLLSIVASASVVSATEISVGSVNISKGSIKSVNITVSNVTNLNTASFNLTFNSSVIKINNIQAGSFWNPGVLNNIQNASGYATSYMDLQAGSGVTGSGTIAVVTIQAIGDMRSRSALNIQPLQGVLLVDVNGNSIPASIQNGLVNIPVKGDVDGYPGITMADAMWIGKAALDKPGFAKDVTTMDIDNDGSVTVADALRLARFVVGIPGNEIL